MIDPLADVVGLLRPGVRYTKIVGAAGRWGVRRTETGEPSYCVVLDGACLLTAADMDPIALEPGDFVLIPATYDFSMSSLRPPPARDFDKPPAQVAPGEVRQEQRERQPDPAQEPELRGRPEEHHREVVRVGGGHVRGRVAGEEAVVLDGVRAVDVAQGAHRAVQRVAVREVLHRVGGHEPERDGQQVQRPHRAQRGQEREGDAAEEQVGDREVRPAAVPARDARAELRAVGVGVDHRREA